MFSKLVVNILSVIQLDFIESLFRFRIFISIQCCKEKWTEFIFYIKHNIRLIDEITELAIYLDYF
jgi:hypothetical protein